MKFGACCCLAIVLSICISFMCFYWTLYNTATAYDEAPLTNGALSYDSCGYSSTLDPEYVDGSFDTQWTQVYKFNAIMYTILVSFSAVSLLCLAVPACSGVVLCCVQCAICPLFAAVVLTGVRRLNSTGASCALSTDIVGTEDGVDVTFADNAATLRALFIAQCVMHLPTVCCLTFAMQFSIMGDAGNASE